MKHRVTLTIMSLLSILLFSLHWADEVARGLEPGTVSAAGGQLILGPTAFSACDKSLKRVGNYPYVALRGLGG